MKQPVIFIVGPTASGKTEVAVRCAEIKWGEIISCDSMQIYRDIPLLTQSPTEKQRGRIPHHLVGVLDLSEEYDVARFVQSARQDIHNILADKKTPFIVGGTGMYVKALIDGIFEGPGKDRELRARLEREITSVGIKVFYERLMELDPQAAGKLHPNDARRIIRALEVIEKTGNTFSQQKKTSRGIMNEYRVELFGLRVPRAVLYKRINERVEEMFRRGVLEEARMYMDKKISMTSCYALGMSELIAVVKGEMGQDEAKRRIQQKTRNYAKRQLTWFRRDKRIQWIDADRPAEEIAEEIVGKL